MRAEDISIVVNNIDPYLTKKIVKKSYDRLTGIMTDVSRDVIVDDGTLPGNDAMMTGSQIATAQLGAAAREYPGQRFVRGVLDGVRPARPPEVSR